MSQYTSILKKVFCTEWVAAEHNGSSAAVLSAPQLSALTECVTAQQDDVAGVPSRT
jgi:hypothetical protein